MLKAEVPFSIAKRDILKRWCKSPANNYYIGDMIVLVLSTFMSPYIEA